MASEIRVNKITNRSGLSTATWNGDGIDVAGIATATSFSGPLTGNVTGNITGNVTGNISGGTVAGSTGTFTSNVTIDGNLGVGGTITYEDVARVDATGISTFREGFHLGPLAGIGLTAYKDGSIRTSGIITATKFDGAHTGDASNLNSIPGANITGTIPAGSLGNVDLSGLKKDIALLSLQTAVDTNRVAYNLSNSFIDQFESDVGIAYSTNAARDVASEFFSTIVKVETDFAPPLKTARSNPTGTVFTRTGSSVTNDTYELDFNGGGDPNYPGCYVDHLWDLSTDWTCKLFYNNSAGGQHSRTYGGYSLLITTDVSKAAGSSPTGVFNAPQSNGNGVTVSKADWGNNRHLTTAYGTNALAVENYAETYSVSNGDLAVDANSTNHNIRAYENSNSQEYGGLVFQHTSSTNTITVKWLNPNSRTTTHTNNEVTITEVPSSGRAIIYTGTGDPLNNLYVSTTYASSSASDWSTHYVTTSNATGICTSRQNTVTGARTKVSGVMLYKNEAGTATLGTDLIVSFTCNGGTNWTALSSGSDYSVGSDFSTGIKTVYLAEKTCTSGTDVRYKLQWANQALGSKETQVHGMALNY